MIGHTAHDIGPGMWCAECRATPCRLTGIEVRVGPGLHIPVALEDIEPTTTEPPFHTGDRVRTSLVGRRRWSRRQGTVLTAQHTRLGWLVVVRWPDHGITTHFAEHLELIPRRTR